MSERELAALKCAQHIIKIKRTHSDYRDSWLGGESNLATEFILLRQRVQTAERERDEARRERDAVREQYAMSLEEHGELMRQREDTSSQLWDCMNERDGWKHRAERAERVVEAAKVQHEAHGVWVQCGCRHFHCLHFSAYQGKCAVTEGAVRALDATPTRGSDE